MLQKIKLAPIYFFLIAWTILQVFPVIYMIISSFKSDQENIASPWSLPSVWQYKNYFGAWTGVGNDITLGNYFTNSIVVTAGSLALISIVSMLAGYALARYHFHGSKLIYALNLGMIAIPVHALMVPVYEYFTDLHLLNSHIGLILVYTAFNLSFSVIIMRSYFETIPSAIIEAARIDGCREWGVFWHIGIPVARGAIATLLIVNVVGIWSELMFASVLISQPEMRTLPVGVSLYAATMYGSTMGFQYAALTMTAVPLLLIYFIFQKQIVKGISLGAVK
jgi:ABC-type glycerol-3-phosphate transport system permease component